VDAAASARNGVAGRVSRERASSAQDERRWLRTETVWSRHPLLVPSRAEAKSAQPSLISLDPPTTVTRRIRHRGEHGISRKAIAQGK